MLGKNRILSYCKHIVDFQNEEILIELGELDKLDGINNAWIGFKCSLTEEQKHSSVMVKVADSKPSNLGSIPGQISKFVVFFQFI